MQNRIAIAQRSKSQKRIPEKLKPAQRKISFKFFCGDARGATVAAFLKTRKRTAWARFK
jgi:hypothetical protein